MSTTKIYLAGPMTGIPQFNFPAFEEAAEVIRAAPNCYGYEVLSPTEIDSKESRLAAEMNTAGDPDLYKTMTGETWGDLLSRDVKLIADEADVVMALPGWEDSKGARLEVFTATLQDKPVYDYHYWSDVSVGWGLTEQDRISAGKLADVFEGVGWDVDEEMEKELLFVKKPLTYCDYNKEAPDLFNKTPASGEVRTTSATGGEKGVKPERLDLIPPEFLEELGRVYGEGAKKYSDNNYLKGYEYRKSLGAMLRHITRWNAGEDYDLETKCHHLVHAAWHCATLFTYQTEGLGEDDRLFKTIEENL